MRVKEMHPLCCISLESGAAGIGDQSPETATLSRARSLPASLAAAEFKGGSDGNARRAAGSEAAVAGVLQKWTNYGKGWRSRWFMLRNGVLSYAKIRRTDCLNGLLTPADDVRFIGDLSANSLSRMAEKTAAAGAGGRSKHRQRTVAIVHLKVTKRFV